MNRFEGLSQQLPLNQTKLKIQQLMKNGSYIMAANQTKELSWMYPTEEELLFVASRCFKKSFETEERKEEYLLEAADFGERLRLRNSNHRKNLVNLADTYRLLRNYKRGIEIADAALQINPTDETTKKLIDFMSERI